MKSTEPYEYQRSRSIIDFGPSHSDSVFSDFFSSTTVKPIEANFGVQSPWDEGKSMSNGPGHLTKLAAMPIYDKKK